MESIKVIIVLILILVAINKISEAKYRKHWKEAKKRNVTNLSKFNSADNDLNVIKLSYSEKLIQMLTNIASGIIGTPIVILILISPFFFILSLIIQIIFFIKYGTWSLSFGEILNIITVNKFTSLVSIQGYPGIELILNWLFFHINVFFAIFITLLFLIIVMYIMFFILAYITNNPEYYNKPHTSFFKKNKSKDLLIHRQEKNILKRLNSINFKLYLLISFFIIIYLFH